MMAESFNDWESSARGTFETVTFAELLARLHSYRVDGVLMLKSGRVKKMVYLQGGCPVFVKSNLMRECLGQILVREKMISQEEMDKSVETMKATGQLQGTILIEMRSISQQNLEYALQRQLQFKLLDLFGWEKGEYVFREATPPPASINLEATLDSVILKGVRRKQGAERLRKWVDRKLDHFVIPHHDLLRRSLDMDLNEAEERLIFAINGEKSLKKLLSSVSNQESMAALIYALMCAGLVTLVDKKEVITEVVTAEPVDPANDDMNDIIFDNIDTPPPPVEFDTNPDKESD